MRIQIKNYLQFSKNIVILKKEKADDILKLIQRVSENLNNSVNFRLSLEEIFEELENFKNRPVRDRQKSNKYETSSSRDTSTLLYIS